MTLPLILAQQSSGTNDTASVIRLSWHQITNIMEYRRTLSIFYEFFFCQVCFLNKILLLIG